MNSYKNDERHSSSSWAWYTKRIIFCVGSYFRFPSNSFLLSFKKRSAFCTNLFFAPGTQMDPTMSIGFSLCCLTLTDLQEQPNRRPEAFVIASSKIPTYHKVLLMFDHKKLCYYGLFYWNECSLRTEKFIVIGFLSSGSSIAKPLDRHSHFAWWAWYQKYFCIKY